MGPGADISLASASLFAEGAFTCVSFPLQVIHKTFLQRCSSEADVLCSLTVHSLEGREKTGLVSVNYALGLGSRDGGLRARRCGCACAARGPAVGAAGCGTALACVCDHQSPNAWSLVSFPSVFRCCVTASRGLSLNLTQVPFGVAFLLRFLHTKSEDQAHSSVEAENPRGCLYRSFCTVRY